MIKHPGKYLFHYILVAFIPALLLSCSGVKIPSDSYYKSKSPANRPDYGNMDYWAAHPWKKDASDSVPEPLKNEARDSIADVFFIHPTTYTNPSLPMGWNAGIDNELLNGRTDRSAILYQASVFNNHCRVFAPRYRQANYKAFFDKGHQAAAAFDTAYADVKAAFDHYLDQYNRGRPVVIASHSQGTLHAARLLKEYFEGKPLQRQLVCAYIIGLPVYTDYFQQLFPCRDSSSTGCFVSWRSFKKNYVPKYVRKEEKEVYVTNPLAWTLEEVTVPRHANRGGILRDFNNVRPELVSAKVHGHVLWVSKPRFFGNIFLTMRNYHIADYNFFYVNMRENLEARIRSYLKNEMAGGH